MAPYNPSGVTCPFGHFRCPAAPRRGTMQLNWWSVGQTKNAAAGVHVIRNGLLLMLLSILACGDDDDRVGGGGYQCYEDVECKGAVLTGIEGLDKPAAAPDPFTSARCLAATRPPPDAGPNTTAPIGSGDDRICQCDTADHNIGFNLIPWGDECLVQGRARTCLFRSDEAPDCDLDDPNACRDVCDELTARTVEDAMHSHDARVRSNRCISHECQFVVEIDGTCFANRSDDGQSCTLSDDEILEL